LLILIATPSIAFSATDTTRNGVVTMSKETAAKVAQDLIAGDECKDLKEIVEQNLSICEKQNNLKDSIITYKDKQSAAKDTIIAAQDSKYAVLANQYAILEKKYKKQKRKGFFKTVGNITLLVGLAAALIIK